MQRSNENREILLLALEVGAGWPDAIREYQASVPDSVVEAQTEGEKVERFAERVIQRVGRIREEGAEIRVCVVATNGATTPFAVASRYAMLRAAAKGMNEQGRLVLVGPSSADGASRAQDQLFELAGRLSDELASTGIGISVRLGQRTDRSGTRPSVHPASAIADADDTGTGRA
jgi:hypothetical protein